MILRMWKAKSTTAKSGGYIRHAKQKVFPKLHAIEGNLGACLLAREVEGGVELVVLTLWDSMEAVDRFAGPEPEKAVIEPEARTALTSFDEYVTHYDVVERFGDLVKPD